MSPVVPVAAKLLSEPRLKTKTAGGLGHTSEASDGGYTAGCDLTQKWHPGVCLLSSSALL